jgi:hypothetical protein
MGNFIVLPFLVRRLDRKGRARRVPRYVGIRKRLSPGSLTKRRPDWRRLIENCNTTPILTVCQGSLYCTAQRTVHVRRLRSAELLARGQAEALTRASSV